jgi:hypothetical protein
MLVEGSSMAISRLTGVCKEAIMKLVCDLSQACAKHHDSGVRGISAQRVWCDEVWSFCYAKEKNVPENKNGSGAGSVWTWIAIDADSKLILSYLCGGRDAEWATQVRRFTCLTNAFSKKFENHCHMVAIYHAYYNFCRVHQTLRVTPAMEAELTNHVWSLEDLVGLLDAAESKGA